MNPANRLNSRSRPLVWCGQDKIYMEAERFAEMASQIGRRSQRPRRNLYAVFMSARRKSNGFLTSIPDTLLRVPLTLQIS
jgi:hypothetical protein